MKDQQALVTNRIIIQIIFIALFLLSGCATTSVDNQLMLDGLYFENNSSHKLEDVRLTVEKTGAFAACSPVLANSTCSTHFEPIVYQGNPVHIIWIYKGIKHLEGPFIIEPPKEIIKGQNASVIVRFDRYNQISTQISY